jgi:AcrR family transcriptional regulator
MAKKSKETWIEKGYEIFALCGYQSLKIEPLAKKVGVSKSSFYHHFADLDLFIQLLLKHHIQQSNIIAIKEQNAININPELINILVDHKTDLLFNRQLRINSNIILFEEAVSISNKIVGDAFKMTWMKEINLKLNTNQMEGIFALAIENFYLKINTDTINFDWLSIYFANLKMITNKFT